MSTRLSRRVGVITGSLLLAATAAAIADITLPSLVGDHMVLQRESRATLWGWASPGETVRVEPQWPDSAAEAIADERGRWQVQVLTPGAGGPFSITIRGAHDTRTIRDVMIGEVWLCSGQSNMEWPLSAIGDGAPGRPGAAEEIAGARHPSIRFFNVPNTISAHSRVDSAGAWVTCTPQSAATFSAVGYFFGRELTERLDVPVGLISADWGGTPIQAWMSPEALETFPAFAPDLEYLETLRLPPHERDARLSGEGDDWWSRLDTVSRVAREWTHTGFDDSGWKTTVVPASWSDELANFDGVVYLRASVEVPAERAEDQAILSLGPIDDYDDAWVNGTHVGGVHDEGRWAEPRRYPIPAGVLRSGRNIIAVRVLDTGGIGGINGGRDQLAIEFAGAPAGSRLPLAGQWKHFVGAPARSLPPRGQSARLNQNFPTALHHGMIAPLIPYTIRGAIWYQGESNRSDPAQYRDLFQTLIKSWRRAWGIGDFPFYFVQIAPFRYPMDAGQTALLRQAQAAALRLPNTGMACTLDIGDPADIHPRNKLDVGRRLAARALASTYGDSSVVPSGPVYRTMSIEDRQIRLRFEHVGGGLVSRTGDSLDGFLIAGGDKQFHTARAVIDGETVVVSSPHVTRPAAIRYAWSQTPSASLFNRDGLPAPPFRTDHWEGPLPAPEDEGRTAYLTEEPGFAALFNGRDLGGWVNVNCAPETWTVADGRIHCTGIPTGVLRTDRQFENFVLELEWRHLRPGGNAGLFVWSDPLTVRGQPFTRSVEVQVMDGLEGQGYTSDGDIFPIHGARMTPENGRGGDRAFPTERRMRFSPEWNHYRVECVDGAISLAVNGKTVTRGRDISPRKGYICLESEGSPVQFRNILIRELPGSPTPLSPDMVADLDEGFRPLYNGVDFSGWKLGAEHDGHWRATDWTITHDGQGADLWTDKSYKDFVMIADWRWTAKPKEADLPVVLPDGSEQKSPEGRAVTARVPDAGDSGIYLRGSSKAQVNIWCWPVGSGEVYGYRTDQSMPPQVRAAATPKSRADAPPGQWNRFVITLKGDVLTVALNGQTVIENARLPGIAESGPIALQSHGSPIQFANLYIREIPASPTGR